jgi:hypothetical protein
MHKTLEQGGKIMLNGRSLSTNGISSGASYQRIGENPDNEQNSKQVTHGEETNPPLFQRQEDSVSEVSIPIFNNNGRQYTFGQSFPQYYPRSPSCFECLVDCGISYCATIACTAFFAGVGSAVGAIIGSQGAGNLDGAADGALKGFIGSLFLISLCGCSIIYRRGNNN